MAPEPIAGRYRLLEPLGRGAMSAVWLADDEELGRRVAVKLLAPRADRARFEREARAAAALSDPHICALYDYGEEDGKPFMVLEYLPNGSLEERLENGVPLPDRETRRIATEIACGLAHAHARGLVHRDLKPANVLFDAEGRAKIADFGIARLGDSHTLTEAGTVLGTASTISPEQAAGLSAGPASDVYSFGVILFRMLTGRLPFVAANAMEVVRMHRDDAPPAVSDLRPDAAPELASLAASALVKDPAARPADGTALLAALGGAGSTATAAAGAAATPPLEEVTRVLVGGTARPRRRPAALPLAALVLGILVLLGLGIAVAVVVSGGGRGAPATPTTAPGLSVPTVPAAAASTTVPVGAVITGSATTARTSTATSTARPATTSRSTTRPATTAPATTAQTTAPATTAATATVPSTTAPSTTASTTLAQTTAPAPVAVSTTTAVPETTAPTTAP